VEDLRVERKEVVEESNGERVCEQRGAHGHEWRHWWKVSIEREKYQSKWGPDRGMCEVEATLEEHTP
jgi:hypothetical protein